VSDQPRLLHGPEGTWSTPRSLTKAGQVRLTRLYSDEEIRRLAPYDIEAESSKAEGILGMAHLEVVPAGQSRPRMEVFQTLGLEESRMERGKPGAVGMVAFLVWRISPSYDLVCMTATNHEPWPLDDANLLRSDRSVYGIRIVQHR
jgi:hypothetical protein